MIQILTYSGQNEEFTGNNVIINSIHDAHSLDDFEINLIYLNDQELWKNKTGHEDRINLMDDLESLSYMIQNSDRTQFVIVFPQNITYQYFYSGGDYIRKSELKNMIGEFTNIIGTLVEWIKVIPLIYENTVSDVCGEKMEAAFYFNIDDDVLIKSSSGKNVALGQGNMVLTTLDVCDYKDLIAFLKKVGLLQERADVPEWMEGIRMFDDTQQIDLIRDNQIKIQEAESNIASAKEVLDKNNRYKSILYTTGDELVDVVLEILGEMLGYDFSDFVDKKKEDFLANIGNDVFIGEIKGVNHNVKSENVSQLDVHYQSYIEEHDVPEEQVHALLIMNHQKKKPLSEREPVHDAQIKLAQRNGSLIIDTYMLLKMFEKYKNREIDSEQCIDILRNNVGLLIDI